MHLLQWRWITSITFTEYQWYQRSSERGIVPNCRGSQGQTIVLTKWAALNEMVREGGSVRLFVRAWSSRERAWEACGWRKGEMVQLTKSFRNLQRVDIHQTNVIATSIAIARISFRWKCAFGPVIKWEMSEKTAVGFVIFRNFQRNQKQFEEQDVE